MTTSFWLSLLRFANRRSKNARTLRRLGIWAYSTVMRANVFLPFPRVLLNGPGKSGTHLLSDGLSLMPQMVFSGKHFSLADFVTLPDKPWDAQFYGAKPRPAVAWKRLERYLTTCPQGMFVTAHARFHPHLGEIVNGLAFKHILLLRDPRDVVVSYMHFVMREPWHHHHNYYAKILKDDKERIMSTICGFARSDVAERPLASIGERFAGFTRWLEEPLVLACRFEDLAGPRGEGELERQLTELERIGDFIERPLTREQAQRIASKMYSKASFTYRKGAAGDWRNHFTKAHQHAFKRVVGELLVRLGYEENSNW
jgi:sulfotransferase family protein